MTEGALELTEFTMFHSRTGYFSLLVIDLGNAFCVAGLGLDFMFMFTFMFMLVSIFAWTRFQADTKPR